MNRSSSKAPKRNRRTTTYFFLCRGSLDVFLRIYDLSLAIHWTRILTSPFLRHRLFGILFHKTKVCRLLNQFQSNKRLSVPLMRTNGFLFQQAQFQSFHILIKSIATTCGQGFGFVSTWVWSLLPKQILYNLLKDG